MIVSFKWSKLSRSLGSQPVRGLYIATRQYSSLCESAVVLTFGGDDIVEVDVRDREQVDSEREKVEVRDKGKGDKHEETTNAQACDIMDGNAHLRHLSHDVV